MKKINKKLNLIFVLLFVFLLSGCNLSMFNGNKVNEQDFRIGNEGITISFLPNAPPTEIYEENPFSIGILLKNEGAHETRNGIASFSIEDEYVEIQNPENSIRFNLKGKSVSMPSGEQETKFIKANTKKIEGQSQERESVIIASLCYPYKTIVDASVCVDTDLYGLREMQKACYVRDISLSTQGAPVAVTKIEPKMLPAENDDYIRPQFIISVKNVNNGDIIRKEKVDDACSSSSIGIDDLNVIKVKAELSGQRLECSPSPLKLKNDKDSIRCVLEEGIPKDRGTYTSPLQIELEYGYMNSISKTFLIKKY